MRGCEVHYLHAACEGYEVLKTLRKIDYPRKLIETLMNAKTGAVTSGVLAPLVLFYMLIDHVAITIIVALTAGQVILFIIRMIIVRGTLQIISTADKSRVDRGLKYYLLLLFGSTFLYGITGLVIFVYADMNTMFFFIMIISGLSAGSISTLSPVYHAVFIYNTVMILIFILTLLYLGTTSVHYFVAFFFMIYLFIVLPSSFRIYKALRDSFEQREKIKMLNSSLKEKVKELEEKNRSFQDLLDITMETIVIFDADTKIVDINQSGLDLFRLTEKREVLGRSITDFVPENELSKMQESLRHVISEPYEIELKKDDGMLFPTLSSGRDMVIDGEKVRIGTIWDLTQIKEKDRLLFQQSRQAAMGEMIGNIAHQWRQPLNALGLLMQNTYYSFESGELDEEQLRRSTEKGQRLMQNMSQTIDDFRDFFKPNKEVEHFSVSSAVNNAVELVSASYKNSAITLERILDDELMLDGYPNEFSQVFLNILSNAKDALQITSPDKAAVRIKSYNTDKSVIVEIEDNAGGIDEKIIQKIFEPYFTTKHRDVGTGIGLYMSKMIIENNMNGKIKVVNTVEGARFTITIPFLGEQEC